MEHLRWFLKIVHETVPRKSNGAPEMVPQEGSLEECGATERVPQECL